MLIQKNKNAKIILDQKDLRTTPRQAPKFIKKKEKKTSNSLGWVREYNARRNLSLCLISNEWDFAWQNVQEHVASRFQGFVLPMD
jgi:hypothetical protein